MKNDATFRPQRSFHFFLTLLTLFLLTSCEEEITPIVFDDPADIVIEGFIEGGEFPTPPIVILTQSIPFTRFEGNGSLDDLFIHDAIVRVNSGSESVELTELCWDDLGEEQKKAVLENFNLGFDSLVVNICLYTDPSLEFLGEIGKQYDLEILTDGKTLTSTTTIPQHIPIDTIYFKASSNPGYWELIGSIQDIASLASFYRYFTSVNEEPFIAPITSVTDDLFFDGQSFEFPLTKAERGGNTPIQVYGLYEPGDTVAIKWSNLDEAHFKFWSTLEFNKINQGPFASYTRVESNIKGGLGIWGGYSSSYYFRIAPE